MALETFKNTPTPSSPSTAWTTTTTAYTAGVSTTIGVADGSVFPSSGQFRVLIDNHLILVTRSSNTLTVVSHESTDASHASGADVFHILTAASLSLCPRSMTTTGDLEYLNASGAPTRLGVGNNGDILTVASGLPSWAAPSAAGTVTSVALSVPSIMSVAGSPITTSGTLAVTLATQAANRIFAGPATGVDATPTFRAAVNADINGLSPTFAVTTVDSLIATTPDADDIILALGPLTGSVPRMTAYLEAAPFPFVNFFVGAGGPTKCVDIYSDASMSYMHVDSNGQHLGATCNATNAILLVGPAGLIRTRTSDGATITFQASDVDDGTYRNFAVLTAGNTPSFAISPPTGGTVSIAATTLSQGGHAITLTGAFTRSGAHALTLTTTGTTNVTLPTTGTLATVAGAESLTNKKLGSLTSNGIVTTSGGDGTLSVTATTGSGSVVLATSPTFGTHFDLESAGVRFSAADGVLTLLGLGNGADESLVIDLDNAGANTIGVSSGTGAVNWVWSSGSTGVNTTFRFTSGTATDLFTDFHVQNSAGLLSGDNRTRVIVGNDADFGLSLQHLNAASRNAYLRWGDGSSRAPMIKFLLAGSATDQQIAIRVDAGGETYTDALSILRNANVVFGGTVKPTGYVSADGTAGATAGPFTTITSIEVKNGIVTTLTGGGGSFLTAATLPKRSFGWTIDGGGSAITTGIKAAQRMPCAGTITRVTLLADQAGDVVVDIWRDTFANYPPTDADTITGGNEPELVSDDEAEDSTLTSWTTAFSAGDVFLLNVDSAATIERLTVVVEYQPS